MRPVVGLLVRPGVPRAAVNLVARLNVWADVRATSIHGPAPRAHFATSPTASGLDRVIAAGTPLCVWVDGPDEVPAASALPDGAALFVTTDQAVVDSLGPSAVAMADDGGQSDLLPVSPFVRTRWRRRAGFPDGWVVTIDAGDEPRPGALGADEDLVAPALAMAAAAVVRSPTAARTGLALGCPMVVDQATADRLSIVDGVHALVEGAVGTTPGPDLARMLVQDMYLSAALSRAARRLFDERHNPAVGIRRVVEHLRLLDPSPPPTQRLERHLDELGTPTHARARYRGRELLADLPTGSDAAMSQGATA